MNFGNFLKNHWLLIVVFLTGTAVLVVEVTGVRILSTYFGNTIYTVSGVIGVILAALSVGYARGGAIADKNPTRYEFFRTIEKGGIGLLTLFILMIILAPPLTLMLPLSWGPFVLALILFFAPNYFLGMLSPFAIKLGQLEYPHTGTGTISGRVFFWSTCGSLFGTIFTAFVLIPQLGLNAIIFGTTLAVLLIGTIGKILTDGASKRIQHFILFVFLLIVLCLFFLY